VSNRIDSVTNKRFSRNWDSAHHHVLAYRQPLLPWRHARCCLNMSVIRCTILILSAMHTRLPEYDYPSNLPAPSRMKTAGRSRQGFGCVYVGSSGIISPCETTEAATKSEKRARNVWGLDCGLEPRGSGCTDRSVQLFLIPVRLFNCFCSNQEKHHVLPGILDTTMHKARSSFQRINFSNRFFQMSLPNLGL
jgi:hypothetical protein